MTGIVKKFESDLPETRRDRELLMRVSLFGQSLQAPTYAPGLAGIRSENPRLRSGLTFLVQVASPAKLER